MFEGHWTFYLQFSSILFDIAQEIETNEGKMIPFTTNLVIVKIVFNNVC